MRALPGEEAAVRGGAQSLLGLFPGHLQSWGEVSGTQGCKYHLDNEVHLSSCEVRVAGTDHLKLFSN